MDLASHLQQEAQIWLLKFIEDVLDVGFHVKNLNSNNASATKTHSQQDNSQIATMLSQLKKVNNWLDRRGNKKKNMLITKSLQRINHLKRKIYGFFSLTCGRHNLICFVFN